MRAATDERGSRAGTGRSLRLGALVPAVLGLAAATYLTVEHFRSASSLACPETATINCTKVTTSSYSHVLGVPVAVVGLVYFLVMTALVTPPAWRERRLDVVRVAGGAAGIVSVIYLLWAELFRVNAICLWCTAVHVCTVWLFGAVLWYVTGRRADTA